MKKITLSLLTLLFAINCFAQTPAWLWADDAFSPNWDEPYAVATDPSNNVYVVGSYTSTSLLFGTINLTNVPGSVFVVKYNSSTGVPIWARDFGGVGMSVTCDPSGNVYVTGTYSAATLIIGSDTLTNNGPPFSDNIFLVKYDGNGNVIWAKGWGAVGGSGYETPRSVTHDQQGNIYLTGTFGQNSSITFGSFTLNNTGTDNDIFIIKLDASGNILWAKRAGGTNLDTPRSLACDLYGNIWMTGSFKSTFLIGTYSLPSNGNEDIFIAKYDANGNVLWANGYGSSTLDEGYSICSDNFGNIFCTGYFRTTINFGSFTLSNIANDLFLVKLSNSGNVIWAKQTSHASHVYGNSVVVDALGDIYVGGGFCGGSITYASFTLPHSSNSSEKDMFVIKVSANGTPMWIRGDNTTGIWGSNGDDEVIALAVDAADFIYAAGYYSWIDLGLMTTDFNWSGQHDIFTAKLFGGASSVGVNEINNEYSNIIYPNPSSGIFIIEAKGDLEIYNVMGEKVFSQKLVTDKTEINLSNQAKGIYFVQIKSGEQIISQKIIIQ